MTAAAAAAFHMEGTEIGTLCQGRRSSLGPDKAEVHGIHLRRMPTNSPSQGFREG